MSKYGSFLYGNSKYGNPPVLAYSVEPMGIIVVNFHEVYVTWYFPSGTFSKIRLVRNDIGFPETSEDGVVVWEQDSPTGSSLEGLVSTNIFRDGEDTPLLGAPPFSTGRYVYYRMFLFTGDKIWVPAGEIADLVPEDTGAQTRVMNMLPSVFTSKDQSPLGVVDTTSPLYSFLDGLSFTYEQLISALRLVQPQHSWSIVPPELVPLQTYDLGLNIERSLSLKNQKLLAREAFFMYSHKGLKTGIQTYAEALTSYPTSISVSPNLLLTVQDSTFYGSTGNWAATSATISSSTTVVPATVANQIDIVDTCKIIASASGSMTLGASDPIRKGVPVLPNTQYTTSCAINSPASAGNITLSIQFFDMFGNSTSAAHSTAATAATSSWQTIHVTATSDATSCYAVLTIAYSASGTYYVDQVCVQLGASVAYDEARAISIFLSPNKTNLVKNPSWEVDATNWTLTGAPTQTFDTNVPVGAYAGTHSLKLVNTVPYTMTSNKATVANDGLAVNQHYVGSIYVQNSAALTLKLVAVDASTTPLLTVSLAIPANASWTRYQLPILLNDSLTTLDGLYMEIDSTASQTAYFDCAQLELGQTATQYFDGTLPTDFGAIWSGTAHASTTLLYVNKANKILRLAQTLPQWVPPNSFWRIQTPKSVEYTNLS